MESRALLDGDDVTLKTFVNACETGDYKQWLSPSDLVHIYFKYYGGAGEDDTFEIAVSEKNLQTTMKNWSIQQSGIRFVALHLFSHWVLLCKISRREYNSLILLDSNTFDEDSQKIKSVCANVCINLGYKLYDLSIQQQHDGHNCGLYVLENLQQVKS